jgi:hypothetical protein
MLFGMQQNLMGIEICVSKLAIGQSIDRIEEIQKQVAGWCIAAQIQLIQNNSNLLDSIKQAECNHS